MISPFGTLCTDSCGKRRRICELFFRFRGAGRFVNRLHFAMRRR